MKIFGRKDREEKSYERQCFAAEAGESIFRMAADEGCLEGGIYDGLRASVPVIDACFGKIIRLVGDFRIRARDERYSDELERFCREVTVGISGKSLNTFADMYLDSLLTYGRAVGRIFADHRTMTVKGLYVGDPTLYTFTCGKDPLDIKVKGAFSKKDIPVTAPQKLLYTTLNPSPRDPRGVSLLRGLPAVSSLLMSIYDCIGRNFERAGNVRYAVTYKPSPDGSDRIYAKERAMAIAKEWADGMNASRSGVVKDFVTVGDVDIRVIGADNKILDTQIPVRQLLEQIVNGIVSVVAAYYLEKAHSVSPDISAYGAAGGVTGTGMGAFFGLVFLVFLLVVNLPMFQRQVVHDNHRKEAMSDLVKMLLATVVPVMLSQVLVRSNGIIAMTLFNHITKQKKLSPSASTSLYGIYESKYLLLMNIVTGITSAITTAMIPSIVAAHETGDKIAVESKANIALKFNLLIAIPCTFGFAFLGRPIVRLLFGDNSPIIRSTMFLGAAACTLYTLSVLFNTIIQSTYKMMIPVRNSAISIVIDVIALFLMLQFSDKYLFALVIGNLILPLVVIALDMITLRKDLHIRFELVRSLIIPTISSVIMSVVMIIVYKALESALHYAIALIAAIFIAIVIYFVCELKFGGITEKELRSVPKGTAVIHIAKKFRLL